MDFDFELLGFFNVEIDEGNIIIRGQEVNGNTFTIRTRRRKEADILIRDLKEIIDKY